MRPLVPALRHPIVQAPMAGGPSTPPLAAAVSAAGGLGFVAAALRAPGDVRADIARVRELTPAPFGVNLFHAADGRPARDALARYARDLGPEAGRRGVALGTPSFDDDGLAAKLDVVDVARVAVVSFAFGCPAPATVERLHASGAAVWVTVTEPDEAAAAAATGADALVVQGVEAGGHRGSFADTDGVGEVGLLPLLRLVRREVDLPLVAAGGIADGAGVAAVLAAGAAAAQIGTAFMRTPEAGTDAHHRAALAAPGRTALTRAFTGRRARGVVNRFMREHAGAPSAYPHVMHLTAPIRTAARREGDADAVSLWAGQAFPLAEERPAGELVERFSADARAALAGAVGRLPDA